MDKIASTLKSKLWPLHNDGTEDTNICPEELLIIILNKRPGISCRLSVKAAKPFIQIFS